LHKTIASRLTAHFNPDGGHLHRYIERKAAIKNSLCEDLVLHDQIQVPTQDFLTACGLILIVGEHGLLELIEQRRLKFIRTRCVFGYVRGTGPEGGLGIFADPNKQRPQDCSIEESVHAALKVIEANIKERKKLHKVIVQNSSPIDWSEILNAVRRESIEDLKQTTLWRSEYESDKFDVLALPGMKQMQVRVIGPGHDPSINVVDTLLMLVRYNADLFLSKKYNCENVSPFFPVGDLLAIKSKRMGLETSISDKLWNFLEVIGIPDFGQIDLHAGKNFVNFLRITSSKTAKDFRGWFHSRNSLNEKELLREYLAVLNEVPWIQRLPVKALRFAVTTTSGLIPGLGQAVSLFDTFVVDRLFRGKSPKFFVDDLTKFKGNLKLQQFAPADRVGRDR